MPFDASEATAALAPAAPSDAFLFETAWEVCNQVGGIYQVVRSKVPLMAQRWRDRYCLIGPYVEGKAQLEIEESPATGWLATVIETVERSGLKVHHGHWLIQGKPRVLLLDHSLLAHTLPELKHALRTQYGIDPPEGEPLLDAAITFGEAVRRVIAAAHEELTHLGSRNEAARLRLLAHFHEWQGGVALPLIRRARLPVATVFTTHATQLGRYVASSEADFYEKLPNIPPEETAAFYNVRAQHAIEQACARDSHVFTTVSQITAEECTSLLGRTPDVITPNGLTISRFNVGHDFQTFHANFKERLHTFTMGYFFPNQRFDLDRTIYMFTSGRFEPHNKGFDLCIEALAQLNEQLKAVRLGVTIVFFIITARPTRSLNPLVLEKRGVLNELHDVCDKIVGRMGEELSRRAAAGERLHLDDLIEEYWELRYRRTQAAFRMDVLPPIVTHILEDDHNDPVLNQLRSLKLWNRAEDPVKVVYHPEFITPVNPLWGIEYEQFVRGCHLGLFPSAYEPWGYTPLECMALGTPAVSSDLAGFGRYVMDTMPDHESWGLSVLKRRGRSYYDATRELADRLFEYCTLSRRERVELRNEVERRSWEFDWSRLGHAYHRAHDLALDREAAQTRR
ncbi:MAG TPA: glycosyltransferase [Polyangiales bacterium]